MFRVVKDIYWIDMTKVIIQRERKKKSRSKDTSKKFTGITFCRVNRMKILCLKQVNGNRFKVKETDNPSPYVIEVEEIVRKKKEKPKLKSLKEEKKKDLYDPRAHISGVAVRSSECPQDFLRPAPYNEKLRRGGRENSLAVAESQLSAMEVLKGRYRRAAKEWPHRCVDLPGPQPRRDAQYVPGWRLVNRSYSVCLTGLDRSLADLAEAAGRPDFDRCLNLTGHNVTVMADSWQGEGPDIKREQYGTRRKHKIEGVSYDVTNHYSKVKRPVKKETRSSSSSDSSDSSGEEEIESHDSTSAPLNTEQTEDVGVKIDTPMIIKLEPEEEIKEDELAVFNNLLEVEPIIKVEDRDINLGYQDDLEQFLFRDEEPQTEALGPEDVDVVLEGLMQDEVLVRPMEAESAQSSDRGTEDILELL